MMRRWLVLLLVLCPIFAQAQERMSGIGQSGALSQSQGPFSAAVPMVIRDSSGVSWAVTIDDGGQTHTMTTTLAPQSSSYLLNSSTDQTTWKLAVTVNGFLSATQVAPFQATAPSEYWFQSTPSAFVGQLWITGGALKAIVPIGTQTTVIQTPNDPPPPPPPPPPVNGNSPFTPTTSFTVLTASNSSGCITGTTGCSGTFAGLTDHCGQADNNTVFQGSCAVSTHGYSAPGPPVTLAATNTDTLTTVQTPQNVSIVSPAKLLYPGFTGTVTTKFICHYQPWFGDTANHISNKQDESNTALVTRQASAMIARGCNVMIPDWYGQGSGGASSFSDLVTKAWRNELDSRCVAGVCPLYMAIMEDAGTHTCAGCNDLATYETDLTYSYATYMTGHASYWKVTDGAGCANRPIVVSFGWPLGFNWGGIKSWIHSTLAGGITCTNEPALATEGEDGLSNANLDGAYQWVTVNGYDNSAPGAITLAGISGSGQYNPHLVLGTSGSSDSWLAVAKNHTAQPIAIGAAYKGFNDSNADWGFTSAPSIGQARKVAEQCGTVWVNSFKRPTASGNFSSASQIKAFGMVVWNDYEEGTAFENGIDNCYTLTNPQITGTTFSWQMSVSSAEASAITIDHFSLWLFDGSGNAQDVADLFTPGATSIAIPSTLPSGTWTLRVQMVGVNSIINRMSPAVTYVKA